MRIRSFYGVFAALALASAVQAAPQALVCTDPAQIVPRSMNPWPQCVSMSFKANPVATDIVGTQATNPQGQPSWKLGSAVLATDGIMTDTITTGGAPWTGTKQWTLALLPIAAVTPPPPVTPPPVTPPPVTPPPTPPPVTPPIVTQPNNTVIIGWTAPTTNVDGSLLTNLASFSVYRGTTLTNMIKLPAAAVIPIPAIQYTDANVSPGSYFYAVTATNSAGVESAQSVPISVAIAVTVPPPPPPGAPTPSPPADSVSSCTIIIPAPPQ